MYIPAGTSHKDAKTDQDADRHKHDLQREIIIQESDLKEMQRKKDQAALEVRKLEKEEDRIKVELHQKKIDQEKIEDEVLRTETYIRSLKKKIALL